MGCCCLRPVAEACDRSAAEALELRKASIPGMGDDASKGEEIEAWVLKIKSFHQTSAAQLYYGYSVQFYTYIHA